MTEHFLIKCFFIGLSAASGVGPIFLLTLNQSSLYGWWKGFATALGASLADTLYFLLAMLGVLSIIEKMGKALLLMEGLSGCLLVIFGIHLFRTKQNFEPQPKMENQSLFISTAKSFVITMFNPFMILFFIFVSVNILPPSTATITKRMLLLGAMSVGLGSLSLLCLIAAFGSLLGSKIKKTSLSFFSRITGIIFGAVGVYLLFDFLLKLFSKQ